MTKNFYSRFLKARPNILHFGAHSHHYWPDVTRDAQLAYWDDSARLADEKWGHFFQTVVPECQKYISQILDLSDPGRIAFASNTHEFILRILSLFPSRKKIRILTTDSEFYSFQRQIDRLKEASEVDVETVPTYPFDNFEDRFIDKSRQGADLIFLSHVFFNSGVECQFEKIISELPKNSLIVLDGYHGFCAVPTSLKPFEKRIFYLAGGYKYAQGGEGSCFLYSPPGDWRPRNTGWFAEFDHLTKRKYGEVPYSPSGMAFSGATMDFSALYRQRAVFELFKRESLDTNSIHQKIRSLQKMLLDNIEHTKLCSIPLLRNSANRHGHFLAFDFSTNENQAQFVNQLKSKQIEIDGRGPIARFGFGLHLDEDDVQKLIRALS